MSAVYRSIVTLAVAVSTAILSTFATTTPTAAREVVAFNSRVAPGTIVVPINPDARYEFDETFRIVLTNKIKG